MAKITGSRSKQCTMNYLELKRLCLKLSEEKTSLDDVNSYIDSMMTYDISLVNELEKLEKHIPEEPEIPKFMR